MRWTYYWIGRRQQITSAEHPSQIPSGDGTRHITGLSNPLAPIALARGPAESALFQACSQSSFSPAKQVVRECLEEQGHAEHAKRASYES